VGRRRRGRRLREQQARVSGQSLVFSFALNVEERERRTSHRCVHRGDAGPGEEEGEGERQGRGEAEGDREELRRYLQRRTSSERALGASSWFEEGSRARTWVQTIVGTTPSRLAIEPAASCETQVTTDVTEKIEAMRATGAANVSRRK